MAVCFRATSKAQLQAFLGQTSATAAGLTHPRGAINLAATYCSNVRAERDVVLPGFGEGAFSRDPAGALAAFRRFCSAQFGQRQSFTFSFLPCAPRAAPEAQRARPHGTFLDDFDGASYGPEYLIFTKGKSIEAAEPPPDVDAQGWAFGVFEGRAGWYPPAFARWSDE
jgi:hypothetical protein